MRLLQDLDGLKKRFLNLPGRQGQAWTGGWTPSMPARVTLRRTTRALWYLVMLRFLFAWNLNFLGIMLTPFRGSSCQSGKLYVWCAGGGAVFFF